MHRFQAPDKRRPVVILSRTAVIPYLHTVMVAPITSTRRGIPSEAVIGVGAGLKHESVANLDHVQSVRREELHKLLGALTEDEMHAVCAALHVATGCDR
jgi:mRNA interferase MazF